MINLEWYRTFIALYRQQNMTRAAEDLRISQPNVSVHLSALENHVGAKLFERAPKGLVPTDAGKELYTQLAGTMDTLRAIELNFSRTGLKNKQVIKLGAPREFFLANISRKTARSESNITVEFGLTSYLLEQLYKGNLNFIISTSKTEDKNYTCLPVFEETFILTGSPGIDPEPFMSHLDKNDFKQAEQWLLQQTWYAYDIKLSIIRRFWKQNFNKRPSVTPKYIIPDIHCIIQAMKNGNGLSIVPEYLAKDHYGEGGIVNIWEGRIKTTNRLYLIYNTRHTPEVWIDEILNIIPPPLP